jgi:hypothetical protein
MDIHILLHFLIICTVINYGLLILWVILTLSGNWLISLNAKLFKVPEEQIRDASFKGIMFYKLAIMFFNLVPLIALHFVKFN